MNVAIIGCGLIGNKRARFLGEHRLKVAADCDLTRAASLARAHGEAVRVAGDWRVAVSDPAVNVVIVATTPDVMPVIAQTALRSGKHVLVDKPAARTAQELAPVAALARQLELCARVGFNHRFHPALARAYQLFESGAVGEAMYIRARYGHGGRLGYEKEWRADPLVSGGGELIDQGLHLIDLSRWFLGDFEAVDGHAGTYFWQMPVDDNAFALLRTAGGKTAWLHASWSEWKNLFCFEFFGKTGKLQVDGLGGSYGLETLTFYKMKPEMGPPEIKQWQFEGEDLSWQREFESFIDDIATGRKSGPDLDDALAALKIAGKIYDGDKSALCGSGGLNL